MVNSIMKDKFPFLDERICNPTIGLVTSLFQWVPEPDDPKIYMVASKISKKDLNGHCVASDINSAAGLTLEEAYRAAVGESIERYSASFVHRDVILSRYVDLEETAIKPSKFAFYADEQYKEQNFCYDEFTETSYIGWTKAVSLTDKKIKLIPASTVYLPYIRNDREDKIWDCVSTGLACSITIEDAILRGIYEVIERDAISNMWFNKLSMPIVDISRYSDIYNLFKKRIEIPNCNYHFVDITTDIAIPTIFGVLEENGGGLLVSASTNNDPVEALKKVMIELSQGRISWKKDFVQGIDKEFMPDFSDIRDFKTRAQLYTKPYMKKFASFVYSSDKISHLNKRKIVADSEMQLLREIVNLLKEKGLEILYVDLTPIDLMETGYHVVRVIIPGMTEITNDTLVPRWGGSRLYNLPKILGYSNKTKTINDFYRVPHPFP